MLILKKLFQEIAGQIGVEADSVQLSKPGLESDLAIACFGLASGSQTTAQEAAQALQAKLEHKAVARAEAIAGYLNIWLKPEYLARALAEFDLDILTGRSRNQTVVIDYFGPNLAKEVHIGHLRNLLQGRGLVNLYRLFGYRVVTVSHVGDWGVAFGKWVVGYLKFGKKELDELTIQDLTELYVQANQELDQADEEQFQDWLLKLEAGDDEAWRYHKRFTEISLQATDAVLRTFKVEFDETRGESAYYQLGRQLIDRFLEAGLVVRQADQSIIFDLSAAKLPNAIIRKSNGASLYIVADIAALKYRQCKYQPSQIIYVVGSEQKLHFRQLFEINRLTDLSQAELIHHSYGILEALSETGSRKKISSREGVVSLDSILERAGRETAKITKSDISDEDRAKIAMSGLTFREFTQNRRHNILYDWQHMFSLTGMSGPYVQYAAVRSKSILDKGQADSNRQSPDFSGYHWQDEHTLIKQLATYPDVLDKSLAERDLSVLGLYAYHLAKSLNRYYEQTTVLDDQQRIRDCRLWLVGQAHRTLCQALAVLGIEIPEKM